MTQTNNDGKKPDTSKDGEKSQGAPSTIILPKDGEKKDAPQPDNAGTTPAQIDPTIGIDKERTLIEIRIPMSMGYWKALGFMNEVLIPTVRRFFIEKAQKNALKNKLISTPPGFRGFNPKKWLKK